MGGNNTKIQALQAENVEFKINFELLSEKSRRDDAEKETAEKQLKEIIAAQNKKIDDLQAKHDVTVEEWTKRSEVTDKELSDSREKHDEISAMVAEMKDKQRAFDLQLIKLHESFERESERQRADLKTHVENVMKTTREEAANDRRLHQKVVEAAKRECMEHTDRQIKELNNHNTNTLAHIKQEASGYSQKFLQQGDHLCALTQELIQLRSSHQYYTENFHQSISALQRWAGSTSDNNVAMTDYHKVGVVRPSPQQRPRPADSGIDSMTNRTRPTQPGSGEQHPGYPGGVTPLPSLGPPSSGGFSLPRDLNGAPPMGLPSQGPIRPMATARPEPNKGTKDGGYLAVVAPSVNPVTSSQPPAPENNEVEIVKTALDTSGLTLVCVDSLQANN